MISRVLIRACSLSKSGCLSGQGCCKLVIDALREEGSGHDRHGIPNLPALPVSILLVRCRLGSSCIYHGKPPPPTPPPTHFFVGPTKAFTMCFNFHLFYLCLLIFKDAKCPFIVRLPWVGFDCVKSTCLYLVTEGCSYREGLRG